MKVEILGGPHDGEVYEVEGQRTSVTVGMPNPLTPLGDPLEPPYIRYMLPVRNGKAYWYEREPLE